MGGVTPGSGIGGAIRPNGIHFTKVAMEKGFSETMEMKPRLKLDTPPRPAWLASAQGASMSIGIEKPAGIGATKADRHLKFSDFFSVWSLTVGAHGLGL